MPLPPASSGQTPPERAHQLTVYLEAVCALETEREQTLGPEVTSEPERLRAILDRTEFARARQRNSDVNSYWLARLPPSMSWR